MKVSLEYLFHYRCDSCEKWWSVGDIVPTLGKQMHCPHCGHLNVVEEISDAISYGLNQVASGGGKELKPEETRDWLRSVSEKALAEND